MTHRTVVLSSFDDYLALDYLWITQEQKEELITERNERLSRFPFSVILQVAYPELDFANRWCWQNFGPTDGECLQKQSQYPACNLETPHSHSGNWITCWIDKIDYDFGFNEWCFCRESDRDLFLEYLPMINWGEKYPK